MVKNRNEEGGVTSATSLWFHIVRIIAAYSVAIGHNFSFCQITNPILQRIPPIQSVAVVLLLLLSGFLTAKSLACRQRTFGEFVCNRIGRIYVAYIPALWLVVAVDAILIQQFPEAYTFYKAYNKRTFLRSVLMLHLLPYSNTFAFGSGEQFWTLSIEWWLYMMAGFLVCRVLPRIKQQRMRFMDLCAMTFLAFIVLLYTQEGLIPVAPIIWGLGVCMFFVQRNASAVTTKQIVICAVLCTVWMIYLGCVSKNAYYFPFVFSIALHLLFSILLTQKVSTPVPRKIEKICAFIASGTYSLYLTHYSIMNYIMVAFPEMNRYLRFWVGLFLSQGVAVLFAWCFEKRGKWLAMSLERLLKRTTTD